MKCKNCGEKVANKEKFCPKCGEEITYKNQDNKKSLNKKSKAVIAVICSLVLIISGTVGGLYFFRNHTDNLTDSDSNYISFSEGFTDVLVTDEKSALEAIASVANVIGIENVDDELKISSINTVDNDTYYRFQQYYNNIPVYGRNIVVSADTEGHVLSLTSNIISLSQKSVITAKITLDEAKELLQKQFKVDNIELDNSILDKQFYYANKNNVDLAYVINVVEIGETVIINAVDGEILDSFPMYKNAYADCKYNGTDIKGIKTDNGQYLVGDEERGIYIFTAQNTACLSKINNKITAIKNKAVPLLSDNNIFGDENDIYSNEEYGQGIQLLTYLQVISDYYKDIDKSLNLSSIGIINDSFCSNNGCGAMGGYDEWSNITSYNFNYTDKQVNNLILGCDVSQDLENSIDTIAHEFTHGITDSQIDWMYNQSNDSGALSEAYSDIFGEILESKACKDKHENPDWINGDRDLANPYSNSSEYPYPATVNDLSKAPTGKNNEGLTLYLMDSSGHGTDYAHFASTIISHCAYLMWNGIDGNEQGKIDTNALANIWYRSLHLLQPNPTFSQCRNAVELSARSLWKSGNLTEKQYDTVYQAFNKVGIDRVSNYANKTLKNDFNMLVLNSEGKERVSAEIKIYPSTTSSNVFFANKNKIVFEGTFNSTSPEEGIHINLKDGRYLVEISDTATENPVEPIGMIIEVDGSSKVATDNLTVYTDFKEITTVVLNNEKIDLNTIYINFLSSKGYNDLITNWYEVIPTDYAIIDINQDGKEELIVSGSQGFSAFYSFAIFGYDEETDSVFCYTYDTGNDINGNINDNDGLSQYYSSLGYSSKYKALMYSATNDGINNHYFFFDSLKGKKIHTEFVLAMETEYDTQIRSYYTNDTKIDEATYNAFIDELKPIEWTKIPNFESSNKGTIADLTSIKMVDCVGITVKELTERLGENYEYTGWGYSGSLNGICYDNIPFIFFSTPANHEEIYFDPKPDDIIALVMCSSNYDKNLKVCDGISADISYGKLKSLGNGELFIFEEGEIPEGSPISYQYKYNDNINIIFDYDEIPNNNSIAQGITVAYYKSK